MPIKDENAYSFISSYDGEETFTAISSEATKRGLIASDQGGYYANLDGIINPVIEIVTKALYTAIRSNDQLAAARAFEIAQSLLNPSRNAAYAAKAQDAKIQADWKIGCTPILTKTVFDKADTFASLITQQAILQEIITSIASQAKPQVHESKTAVPKISRRPQDMTSRLQQECSHEISEAKFVGSKEKGKEGEIALTYKGKQYTCTIYDNGEELAVQGTPIRYQATPERNFEDTIAKAIPFILDQIDTLAQAATKAPLVRPSISTHGVNEVEGIGLCRKELGKKTNEWWVHVETADKQNYCLHVDKAEGMAILYKGPKDKVTDKQIIIELELEENCQLRTTDILKQAWTYTQTAAIQAAPAAKEDYKESLKTKLGAPAVANIKTATIIKSPGIRNIEIETNTGQKVYIVIDRSGQTALTNIYAGTAESHQSVNIPQLSVANSKYTTTESLTKTALDKFLSVYTQASTAVASGQTTADLRRTGEATNLDRN